MSCVQDKMFKTCVYYVYPRFNERVRIGDCCDPVDHVVFTRRIFLSDTLRQGGSLSSDIGPIYLTLVLLRGGCTNPPNGYRPGAQNRTAKG